MDGRRHDVTGTNFRVGLCLQVARLEAARLGGLLRGAVSKLEASMSQASQAQGSRAAAEEAAKSVSGVAKGASRLEGVQVGLRSV
eukprot:1157307-Pelagomonas_calceolata.AAC.3